MYPSAQYVEANIRRVVIDTNSSGDTTLIAAESGKKLRVLDYLIVASGDVDATFQSEAGSGATDLTGPLDLTTNSGAAAGFNPFGHFETVAGEKLNLNLSGAVQVSGHLTAIALD